MKNAMSRFCTGFKNTLCKFGSAVKQTVGKVAVAVGVGSVVSVATNSALAVGDDIASTITTLSGYWTSIETAAIGVVLFVVGRKLLRKF